MVNLATLAKVAAFAPYTVVNVTTLPAAAPRAPSSMHAVEVQAGTLSARVIRTDDSIFAPEPPRNTPLIGGMSS